jgi:hypothetical protein
MLIPEIFDQAIQASFSNKTAFMGSPLAQAGVVVVRGTMPQSGPEVIGDVISVPYFESIGDFIDLGGVANDGSGYLADGVTPIAPKQIGMTKESERIQHSVLPFQVTQWARANPLGDPYQSAAQQVVEAAQRRMDAAIIAAAVDSSTATGLVANVYSATSPRYLDYDVFVDAKMLFRDWQDGIAGMVVHSKTLANLWKLKDALGRPLLIKDPTDGAMPRLHGLPIIASDRLPIGAASTLSPVSATGTAPPAITLVGTPSQYVNLVVQAMSAGGRGSWALRWSLDGGTTWVQDGAVRRYVQSAPSVALTDAGDNLIGVSLSIASGAASVDNVWTASTNAQFTSLIVKRESLAFWFNQSAVSLRTIGQPMTDSELAALHLYFVAHRYKRCGGSPLPGVVQIQHN